MSGYPAGIHGGFPQGPSLLDRALRRSGRSCVHRVSAWATEHGLILGQESVAERSHEIAALPALLITLHLKGVPVTIDAAGCQTEIVRTIRAGGGDYLRAVKGNPPTLHDAVRRVFADAGAADFAGVRFTQHESVEDGHGRHEERYVTVIEDPKGLPDGWLDVGAVVQVHREREANGVNATTTHYYIGSLKGSAKELGRLIRRHWAVENELHWVLDVSFGEDANRTADRNASANLGVVRRTALSLLTQAPGPGPRQQAQQIPPSGPRFRIPEEDSPGKYGHSDALVLHVVQRSRSELYQLDETAWLEQTAELVRSGRWPEIDPDTLAEYLTDMARRDRREVFSRLVVL